MKSYDSTTPLNKADVLFSVSKQHVIKDVISVFRNVNF
jgi:hypothetical protein